MNLARSQVLRHRLHTHQLDRAGDHGVTDAAVLDLGIQNTGSDAVGWSLVNRGVSLEAAADANRDLALAWTLRGAPHAYRRDDIAQIADAVTPFSDADAAKRIFTAAKPLREAGIAPLEALDAIAAEMADIVGKPMVKGDLSGALRDRMPAPYLRFCVPCDVVHMYEQTFRLSALRAGLELQPGTSPPVLEPIPGWKGPQKPTDRLQVIRAFLHFLGPATQKEAAAYLDAPVKDVKAHWPDDAVEVTVDDQSPKDQELWALQADIDTMADAGPVDGVRLLSPFDPYLQTRDRARLVPGKSRRKELWVTLGRPGAILVGEEILGTWRPRASGTKLSLAIGAWQKLPTDEVIEQAKRLATWRGCSFAGLI